MSDYETLQKLAYGLIAVMLLFHFSSSLIIYEQKIYGEDGSGLELSYRLNDFEGDGDGEVIEEKYSFIRFDHLGDVMQNLSNLSLLTVFLAAFFAWKMKEVIEGSDDLEIVRKVGFAVSALAIFSTIYSVYAIPNALEEEWEEGLFNEKYEGSFDYDGKFIGESEETMFGDLDGDGDVTVESGPETGWYVLVLGAILGVIIYLRVKNLENLGPSRKLPEIPTEFPQYDNEDRP